jgi:hypothetical protein
VTSRIPEPREGAANAMHVLEKMLTVARSSPQRQICISDLTLGAIVSGLRRYLTEQPERPADTAENREQQS